MTYHKDLVSESSQQLSQTLISNKKTMENSLRMRSMAYLAQVKANLLTETIYEVEHSRKNMQKELFYKDELMLTQSRNAAMGEMISMIAHQWRQPISAISMGANNIMTDVELGMIDKKNLKSYAQRIMHQTQELSKTIDDFRDFFKPDKMIQELYISEVIQKALHIVRDSLINNGIEIKVSSLDNQKIETYSRELMQVLINIINNAKDALLQSKIKNKEIEISEEIIDGKFIIKIYDNGDKIDEKIIDKIFNPYFTTKDKKNGTGLGLYMSKTIIEKHLLGRLSFHNEKSGVSFKISLPFSIAGRGDLR
ncbi:MAG: HAMP domain-containing sensor histidine kinase [Campylobacterota bacterium]|nr:HAMP domain-containing sensor histidine kinase [Campylobacterota bacterium]